MATTTEQHAKTEVVQDAKKSAKSLKDFFNKFNNDWVMSFASALAFNLITAILPILIAIIAIVGLTFGHLDPTAKAQLLQHLQSIFPGSGSFLTLAFDSLNRNAGLLSIIAILLAIFGGSRLFVSIEGYFDIIYHTRPRNVIKQNIMAIVMLLIFIVLTVPMTLASSIPAVIQVVLKGMGLSQLAGSSFIFGLIGILVSLFISWVLFEAIYIVVPNQHISFRNSWLGAVVAAVLLQIYLSLFPLYVTHFLGSYSNKTAGTTGFAVILLFFFYYFAVILLIGAEINAYFAEDVHVTPNNLAVMIHELTSHLPTTEKDVQEQATPTHKQIEPKDIRPKSEAQRQQAQASIIPEQAQSEHTDHANHTDHQSKKRKSSSTSTNTPRVLVFVEVIAGTALAFFLQLFQIRRKKS
ncbi:MAG TPA: YihY/virulence factor BrkB family protein [Ktedonobacteraceae bacterium]|nr:YihY/virulence factor BrkB family protein [Ktedonobacteraceae bacterium]